MKEVNVNVNGLPLYEKSQKEIGGVTIRSKTSVHYFDLKKIKDYHYIGNELDFELSGKRVTVYKDVAKALNSALTDWHRGEIV